MKKMISLLTVLLSCLTTVTVQAQNDKEFLLNYFQQTQDELVQSIKDLDEDQLSFKASPASWSVSQCMEHIVLTESMLLGEAKKMLSKPANPEKKPEVKNGDEDIIKGMTDRSAKFQAPDALQPKGDLYTNAEEAIAAFTKQREEVLEYLDNITEEELRNHVSQSPNQDYIDAYQFMLYIAGHSARHRNQIEEVKDSPEFP